MTWVYAIALIALVAELVLLSTRDLATTGSRLRSLAIGLAMLGGNLLVSGPYGTAFRRGWAELQRIVPRRMIETWSDRPVVAWLAAFVVWDAAGYAYHWLGHHTAVGWAAHQPHHSGTHFDLTIGLRQSWIPIVALPVFCSTALFGFSLRTMASVAALSNVVQFLQHSASGPRLGWIEPIVMTAVTHHRHHVDPASNLGPVFTVWDRLAGTWLAPTGDLRQTGAMPDRPTRLLDIELAGWVQLGRRLGRAHRNEVTA